MYWRAEEYNAFEFEIIGHMNTGDEWFLRYCERTLVQSQHLYSRGLELKKIDWSKKTNEEIKEVLEGLLQEYRELACPWYAQYPLDEYFEDAIERKLVEYITADDPDFRKYVLIFTDPKEMTEVAQERWQLVQIARDFMSQAQDFDQLSEDFAQRIRAHLDRFAYINRGLATSEPYTFQDIIDRLKEMQKQIEEGKNIEDVLYDASEQKVEDQYIWALKLIKPKSDFQRIINHARLHSYIRNRRVEAFFNADYGASFMYAEIAKRVNFNPDWIMEISVPEMFGALEGKSLPNELEMARRFDNYAMIVRNAQTTLVTDPQEIKKMEQEYSVDVTHTEEIHGKMACLGGIIRGRAKICLDKKEIGKVERGDILVAQFTTPDFVPAMEKAAAIVADQGGLSSHASIVSRELGVPCVIATQNGTRIIKDGDLLEVDAQKGVIKILERAV
jgi:phosphohistidine swiveling domain-containing protein